MKQSGRASLIMLATAAMVILLGMIFLFGKESLTSVGTRFMSALARGDVDTLTKMSLVGDETPEQMHKEWDFAVNTAGKHYRFFWRITSELQADERSGSVRMQITRNADTPGGYEEAFQLPLEKVNGEWKVDVRGISREMYPGLPR